jgi:hypothetical protein
MALRSQTEMSDVFRTFSLACSIPSGVPLPTDEADLTHPCRKPLLGERTADQVQDLGFDHSSAGHSQEKRRRCSPSFKSAEERDFAGVLVHLVLQFAIQERGRCLRWCITVSKAQSDMPHAVPPGLLVGTPVLALFVQHSRTEHLCKLPNGK